MPSPTRPLLALLCLLSLVSIPQRAAAQAPIRVTVLRFSGAGGGVVRDGVVRALLSRDDVELVPSSAARGAARSLGVSLNNAAGREATARELSLSGMVGGRVERRRVAYAIVYGPDGDELERVRARAGNVAPLARAMERKSRTELAGAILRLRWSVSTPPEAPAGLPASPLPPAPAAEEPEKEEEPGPFVSRPSPWLEAFSLSLDVALNARDLRFTDDLHDALARYQLKAAPGVGIHASFFPLRPFVRNPAAHFGVVGGADFVFVSETEDSLSSGSFETQVRRWSVELRYELVLRNRHRVHAGLGLGEDRFSLDRLDPVTPGDQVFPILPSITYRYLRPSLGARVSLPRDLYLVASGGFRVVSERGDFESEAWFPRSEAYGFDLSGYLAYRPSPFFELRGGIRYTHYVHDLRPEPGDPIIAGGAVDQWRSLFLSFVALAPGAG